MVSRCLHLRHLLLVAVLATFQFSPARALSEKETLVRLYRLAGGGKWDNKSGWEEAAAEFEGKGDGSNVPNLCAWYGVSCEVDDGVIDTTSDEGITHLNLSGNQISGKITKQLYAMPSLKHIDLKNNLITDAGLDGMMQDGGSPLKKLILSENRLTSLSGIENAPESLEELHCNENPFTKFPSEVFALVKLKVFMMTHITEISEPFPKGFGKMKNLRKLLLWYNGFTGTLATELGHLKKLEELAIDENKITGSLPSELGKMYNLKYLSIQNFENDSGRITGKIPQWEDLSYLKEVYLDYNGLTGTFPPKFLKHSNVTSKSCFWGFDQNELEGELPEELNRFERLKIDIRGNKISKIPKKLCKEKKWMNGNVGQFGCDAILCPAGSYAFAGRQETKDIPCKSCKFGKDGTPYMGSTECVDAEGGQSEIDEKQILVKLALNTGLDKWTNGDGWKDDLASVTSIDETSNMLLDYCSWYGIKCNGANQVEVIKLSDNGLKGKITKDLFQLKALKHLDLSRNEIHLDSDHGFGFVGQAKILEKLNLDGVPLRSWTGIDSASNLRELTVDDTELEGPFPVELLQLTKLKVFSCQFCGITGWLPKAISDMSSLENLRLYGNLLTGKIHSEIGYLSQLRELELSENEFEGSLPSEIGNLDKLEHLAIHQMSNKGDGLTGDLPAFDTLPNIKILRLDKNSFGSSIPTNFLSGISDKSQKLEIGLGYNMITGSVPASLASFDKINIDLIGNQITSIDSALCKKSEWQSGEVGIMNDSCDAILCPPGTYSIFGMGSKTLNTPCVDCPSAEYMGTASCTAEDESKYAEKKIIEELYFDTNGPDWSEDNNWATPGTAICDYTGVTCDEGSHDNEGVTEIDLTNMGLSGTLPSSVWTLPHLKTLIVQHTSVQVNFDGMSSAQKLKVLNVANTNTNSLAGISGAPLTLHELYLDALDLQGPFPDELLNMRSLKILKMDYNHFTGSLPGAIDNLSSLEEFWCYANDFGGEIPSSIGNLSKLKVLVLGENKLTGFLPEELQALKHLELLSLYDQKGKKKISGPLLDFSTNTKLNTLVLAKNTLKGHIPSTFLGGVSSNTETVVDLSFNHLSGTVPVELKRFDALFIDLVGNKFTGLPSELCENGKWMNGKVGDVYGNGQTTCDAIMCPIGYFNEMGRLVDKSRPCHKCVNLEKDNPYFGSPHCGTSERTILMELYEYLGGDNWARNQFWMDDKVPICKWEGVGCLNGSVDEDEGVISLLLAQNKMDGGDRMALYSDLFWALPELRELDIKDNKAPLTFTGIGFAGKLETLAVSTNGIKDITGIGNARSLKELHLTDNGLDMPLEDTELFQLTGLEKLFISYNSFRGTLPAAISQLKNLKEFWCYKNKLFGQLPAEIGLLSDIEYLVISENLLTGTLPPEMNELTKLKDLALFSQHGTDGQIEGPLLSFSKLTQITTLDLEYNQLSGTIPNNFFAASTVKDERIRVALNHNQLSGAVPSSLGSFDNLSLEIVGNEIEAIPDALCDPFDNGEWMDGMLGLVGSCDAIACPPFTFYEEGRQVDPNVPCAPCPDAPDVFVGHDSCIEANKEREILMELFEATGGEFWINNINWGNNRMPICSWSRVFCGLGNEDKDHGVVKLDMETNQLDGEVPNSIFELPELEELNLKKNSVTLTFDAIGKAENLEVLYLSEIAINSMNGIGKAPALRRLHITGCNLNGPFPDEIFDLASSLQELYMAYNDFTGTLPTEIGTLTMLTDLYAYDNELQGTIPTEVGNMISLRNLVLAENLISGQIPSEMSSMTNLGLFSCFRRFKSGPKLSGTLPDFNENPQLTDLYLDRNEISGNIPTDFLDASSNVYLVNLAGNLLTGEVPKALADLTPFQIELEDNMITKVPNRLCDGDDLWQQGDLGKYGCDAFLCKPGFYGKYGRQNSTDSACIQCDLGGNNWGSTTCGGKPPPDSGLDQPTDYQILMELYLNCGGSAWNKRKNWAHHDVDVCDWDGISCTDHGTVRSIQLGANNLVGTPPKSLFDLPDLEILWLYSNPIVFSFDNIASAENLYDLRLESTNLGTVKGIGNAQRLEFLNLRFNRLNGNFPSEILQLKNLISLNIGDNNLQGPLPSSKEWAELKTLEELRLGVNRFSGQLPDFAGNWLLSEIDISHNNLSGDIPSSFLPNVPSEIMIEINLANNRITGPIPDRLDRFKQMVIYLRNNQITDIPKDLCDEDNGSWNKGDVARFSCDAILCPPGFYAKLGRQSTLVTPCLPCDLPEQSPYFGHTSCSGASTSAASHESFHRLSLMSMPVLISLSLVFAMQ